MPSSCFGPDILFDKGDTAMRLSQIFAAALLILPALAFAQKREDILSIQRDVAQLQDQIRQMQEAHDKKLTQLEGLIKQLIEQQSR